LPTHEIDTYRNAGLLAELLGVGTEEHLVRIDELGRPQHPKRCSFLHLELGRRNIDDWNIVGGAGSDQRQCSGSQRGSAERERLTPGEADHNLVPSACSRYGLQFSTRPTDIPS